MTIHRHRFVALVLACAAAGVLVAARQPAPSQVERPPAGTVDAQVDKIFSRWNATTPGCAVGASVGGRVVLSRAYGLADLEHDVKNTPETIFEGGSVSKQFTAAAVLLLVKEGKVSLDDPARKYLPELPDFGAPLLVRHMLNHTSGLRDWGSVEAIAGWPRTTRVNTHAHVLDVLARQRAVNFTPGTRYSYSNSGYNLSAILVARVSGMSFAEFSQKRIFGPMGMTRTSWRDDHTRVVKNRAIAYSDDPSAGSGQDRFHIDMPFENVHGNGGLLTTVGDLLTWNENFTSPKVGDAAFVNDQQTPGKFNDGRVHQYALGLTVGTYKGVRQVEHSGSTAGYRAHLTRYPDQRVSVAVLCNVSTGAATQYAHEVADLYLGSALKPATPSASHALTDAEATRLAGLYRNVARGIVTTIVRDGSKLRLNTTRGPELFATSPTRFITAGADVYEFNPSGGLRVTDEYGTVDQLERVERARPTAEQLRAYVGSYNSTEAETKFTVDVEGGSLVMKQRPDRVIRLTPLYADAFSGQVGTVIFRRDTTGRVNALSVIQDRVWDLRFARDAAAGTH
jgi:CubicO group peptidase (beta-lactamase class C family)